ncbi:MAG: class I SAM-dependent methyltransferase [Oligoflexus sp.]
MQARLHDQNLKLFWKAFTTFVSMLILTACVTQPAKQEPAIHSAEEEAAEHSGSAFDHIPHHTEPGVPPLGIDFPDVPYVPTPEIVVRTMLLMGQVDENDIVYDLGSGDGRIPILAAEKLGARGVGVEINRDLVELAHDKARYAKVEERVRFLHQDLFDVDLSDATVVTLYLLPDVNIKLRPKLLRELKPGTRIVSHAFDMGEWQPEQVKLVAGTTVYMWTVPEKIPEHLLY